MPHIARAAILTTIALAGCTAALRSSSPTSEPPSPARTTSRPPSTALATAVAQTVRNAGVLAAKIDATATVTARRTEPEKDRATFQVYRIDGVVRKIDEVRDRSATHVVGDTLYFTPSGELFLAKVGDVRLEHDAFGRVRELTDTGATYYFDNVKFIVAMRGDNEVVADPANVRDVLAVAQAARARADKQTP